MHMEFVNEINSETLIICSNSVKEKIIEMKVLKPIKIMNMTEFLAKYLFDYDEAAILYIMNRCGVKYDVAVEYINNLYYIKDKHYRNGKLDLLVDLKRELTDFDLLKYSPYFKDYLKRAQVIIYDLDLDEYLTDVLSNLKYTYYKSKHHRNIHEIYEAPDMESEVNFVAKSICKLIDDGIKIKNIKLTNVDESYYQEIERIFRMYNLRVNIPYKCKLTSYPLVQKFVELYAEEDSVIKDILDKINDHSVIYNELLKVINKNSKYNDKNLIIYKLENTYITSKGYDNGIEIIDYLDYVWNDDLYVFMLGFNEGIIPKYYKDTDYITDNISKLVLLEDTATKNIKLKRKIKQTISDIKNLVITYKLKDYTKTYYPSSLTSSYEVKEIPVDNISYSEIYDKIRLVKCYDDYFKYGYKNDNFNVLAKNYELTYNSFSNKYRQIERDIEELKLSYSKLQIYNKCAFRYYLTDVLKLDIFEENFSTIIGSMVHFVMEKCLSNNNTDIDKYVTEYLGDREFSNKEYFFIEKYKESIRELLNQVLLEREYMLFNQAMYEKKIDVEFGNKIHFAGIIDKVLYYVTDDFTYVALIDYKTGNDDITLKYLKYGLNIQLPIYLYLASKLSFTNPNVKYVGFYLQKFNIADKDYRLVGYSNSDIETLKVIDKNYNDSKIIKNLKTNKDGSFFRYAKMLSDSEMTNLKVDVEKIIRETIAKIKENEFPINPKVCGGENLGCEYCKFKDICFKTFNDEVTIYASEDEVID